MGIPVPSDHAFCIGENGDRDDGSVDNAIFAARFAIGGFASSFRHCEQVANYVAQFVTSNLPDPDRLNSMLSMGLNEILEMAYRYHGADGALNLLVKQPQSGEEGSSLQVVVGIPADSAALAAYDWCREQIGHAQAHNHYSNLVREGFESGPYKACLVELALIYRVHLAIKTEPSRGRATVTMVINTNQNEQ